MAAQKMKLQIIQAPDEGFLSQFMEEFISQITNPETMQIQFEVVKTPSSRHSFYAFIL